MSCEVTRSLPSLSHYSFTLQARVSKVATSQPSNRFTPKLSQKINVRQISNRIIVSRTDVTGRLFQNQKNDVNFTTFLLYNPRLQEQTKFSRFFKSLVMLNFVRKFFSPKTKQARLPYNRSQKYCPFPQFVKSTINSTILTTLEV